MAIKINGTTVIDDSGVFKNVTGLKTVNSTSILGAGDIPFPSTLGGLGYTLPAADGSSGQVLKTNGSKVLSWVSITSGTVTSVSGTGTVSGLTLTGTVTTSGNLILGGTLSLTSSQVTTALGFTPYNATNPSGYTSNTGTVTSVSGTGTVSGLTLSGTVSTSGSLTLGGTLSLTSGQVTTALDFTPYNSTNPSGYITASSSITGSAGGLSGTPNITVGTVSATSVSDSNGSVRSVPINSKTAAYTLTATDNGQCISITTGGVTIPASVMSAGNVVTIYNNSGTSQTLTSGSGLTLQWAGQATSTTGNRTLGLYGIATVLFISATSAVISGGGLT